MDDRNSNKSVPLGRHDSLKLPSLRAPRDLSLGGNGRGLLEPTQRGGGVKRKFAPTIPAPKVKKERIEETSTEAETSTRNEGRHGRGRGDRRGRGQDGRGRGQGRGHNVIYQKSIFEDWSDEKARAKQGGYGYGGGGGGGSYHSRGSVESMSSILKVKEELVDESHTDEIMKNLLNDNFVDNDSLATVDPSMFPVVLDVGLKSEPDVKLEDLKPSHQDSPVSDVKIKEEKPDGVKPKTAVPWNPMLQWTSQEQVFIPLHENKKLLLIHLPDVLPGYPSANSVAGSSTQSRPIDGNKPVEIEENIVHSLKDFNEGFLGKMKVRRSGKVEFEIGKITFNGIGLPCKILQEVVVCDVEKNSIPNPDRIEGDMTVIGHINHKINFTPKIDNITDAVCSR